MPNISVMAFSPRNIEGCLLKKGLQREGSRAPQDPPLATPLHLPAGRVLASPENSI